MKTRNQFSDKHATFALDEWVYAYDFAHERLTSQFKTANLKDFGLENLNEAIVATGAMLHYLEATEHKDTQHYIASISRIDEENVCGSTASQFAIWSLRHPTAMVVFRWLRFWIKPLPRWARASSANGWCFAERKKAIEERLQIVDAFYQSTELTDKILEEFRHMADLERLISKKLRRPH